MPPAFLFDIAGIDLDRVLYDGDAVREMIPQRGHFQMLDGVCHVDHAAGHMVGYKDVRDDEFWVAGHIPGRPLFPGVLMIELGAQLASFYTRKFVGWKGFIGFGGVDGVKFRQQVAPGCRLYILGHKVWERHRRICCNVQGVVNGQLVFEGAITGAEF